MSIFRRPDYKSDATQFIDQLKAQRPELDEQQRAGRALLWDKQVDRKI
ncbi:MAG: acetyl-CoA carboxyl transferase, partial [Acidovorax sp. 17-64-282]